MEDNKKEKNNSLSDLDSLMKIKPTPNKYRLGAKLVENQNKKVKLELEKRLDDIEKTIDKKFKLIEEQLKKLFNQRAKDAHRIED